MTTRGVSFQLAPQPSAIRNLIISPTATAMIGESANPNSGTIVAQNEVHTTRTLAEAEALGLGAGSLHDALEAYYAIANGPVVWARMEDPSNDNSDLAAHALAAWQAIGVATPAQKGYHHIDIYATNGYAAEGTGDPFVPTNAASTVVTYLEGLAGQVATHNINAVVIPDNPFGAADISSAETWGDNNTGDTVWISWNDGMIGTKTVPGSVIRAAVMANLDAAEGGPLNSPLFKAAPHVSKVSPAWTDDNVTALFGHGQGSALVQEAGDYIIYGDEIEATHNYEALKYIGDLRRFIYVRRALGAILRPYRGERPGGELLETIEEDLNNHYGQYVDLGYFADGSLRLPAERNTASPLRRVAVEWVIDPIGDIEAFTVYAILI